ncbi:MAG: hypothetical protein J7623_11710 [Chitinophaga sp.]|uniref:hypothetical protein n=1 Tax=Chitinophaga sp. TaxID=1869181 RepID=UPI001B090B0B|nr:hypothetical protein [Chitinophaga sp.]MBO9729293.1 hypothetical protein [Chitinophaga sp.]
MRILVTALLSAIVLLTVSCSKDKKDDSRQRKYVSMKLDNRIYLAETPKGIIYVPDLTDSDPNNDFPRMVITAQTYGGDQLSFTLAAPTLPFTPGTYPATKKGNGLLIMLNSSYTTLTSEGSADFYITITRIDNMMVEGTFSGTLKETTGAGGPRGLRDGSFRTTITQVSQ